MLQNSSYTFCLSIRQMAAAASHSTKIPLKSTFGISIEVETGPPK